MESAPAVLKPSQTEDSELTITPVKKIVLNLDKQKS